MIRFSFLSRFDPSRGAHPGLVDVLRGGGYEGTEDSVHVAEPEQQPQPRSAHDRGRRGNGERSVLEEAISRRQQATPGRSGGKRERGYVRWRSSAEGDPLRIMESVVRGSCSSSIGWIRSKNRETKGEDRKKGKKGRGNDTCLFAGGREYKQESSGTGERNIGPCGERHEPRKWPSQEVHPLQRFFAYLAVEGRTWRKCHYHYARQ